MRRAENAIQYAREARAKYEAIVRRLTGSYRADFLFGEQTRWNRNFRKSAELVQQDRLQKSAGTEVSTIEQIADLLKTDVTLKSILHKIKARRSLRKQQVSPWVM